MIPELELVVLLHNVEEFGLQRGDIGTVVHAYTNGPAYEVEFVTADGYTAAVLTFTADEIRSRQGKELLQTRSLAEAHSVGSNEEAPASSSKR